MRAPHVAPVGVAPVALVLLFLGTLALIVFGSTAAASAAGRSGITESSVPGTTTIISAVTHAAPQGTAHVPVTSVRPVIAKVTTRPVSSVGHTTHAVTPKVAVRPVRIRHQVARATHESTKIIRSTTKITRAKITRPEITSANITSKVAKAPAVVKTTSDVEAVLSAKVAAPSVASHLVQKVTSTLITQTAPVLDPILPVVDQPGPLPVINEPNEPGTGLPVVVVPTDPDQSGPRQSGPHDPGWDSQTTKASAATRMSAVTTNRTGQHADSAPGWLMRIASAASNRADAAPGTNPANYLDPASGDPAHESGGSVNGSGSASTDSGPSSGSAVLSGEVGRQRTGSVQVLNQTSDGRPFVAPRRPPFSPD